MLAHDPSVKTLPHTWIWHHQKTTLLLQIWSHAHLFMLLEHIKNSLNTLVLVTSRTQPHVLSYKQKNIHSCSCNVRSFSLKVWCTSQEHWHPTVPKTQLAKDSIPNPKVRSSGHMQSLQLILLAIDWWMRQWLLCHKSTTTSHTAN